MPYDILSFRDLETAQMDSEKRKAVEAAGWKIGDAADFLEMSDEERQVLDERMSTMRPKQKCRCTCGILERASREPGHVIRWDDNVGEFYIAWGEDQRMNVYYCPICGGSAPPSRRGSLFHTISQAERERLFELTSGIETVQDVISQWGEPDLRMSTGLSKITPERDDQPETAQSFPAMIYSNLSEVAEVRVVVFPMGRVEFLFSGKEKKESS